MMRDLLVKEWLQAALIDIGTIEHILDDAHLTSSVAFHSQQAIEKTLKALLMAKEVEFKKIHSLEKLFALAKDYYAVENYNIIEIIDTLYIDSRYPGDMGLLPYGRPTLEDAKEFYEFAYGVFDEVCRLLGLNKETLLK